MLISVESDSVRGSQRGVQLHAVLVGVESDSAQCVESAESLYIFLFYSALRNLATKQNYLQNHFIQIIRGLGSDGSIHERQNSTTLVTLPL